MSFEFLNSFALKTIKNLFKNNWNKFYKDSFLRKENKKKTTNVVISYVFIYVEMYKFASFTVAFKLLLSSFLYYANIYPLIHVTSMSWKTLEWITFSVNL